MSGVTVEHVVRVHIELWGASPAWIEAIFAGLEERHALNVESTVCPAYAGIFFEAAPENATPLITYAQRCRALALRKKD